MIVIKRNGEKEKFQKEKIIIAINNAIDSIKPKDTDVDATQIANYITDVLKGKEKVRIEKIQDMIEDALFKFGNKKVLKAFITYRHDRLKNNKIQQSSVNVFNAINEYIGKLDWRVNANANQEFSLGGLILNTSGKMIANYWLDHVYPEEIGDAHRNGDIHIHDLDMLSGYCAGWSLKTLLNEGFNGVPNRIESKPPKHLSSAVGQIVNFFGTLQNEWAGAQAFSSFDTYMAPFVRADNLSYEKVKQHIQELIFSLNVPARWGCQCVIEGTECLTENGWKLQTEIEENEKIATYNIEKNIIEYLVPDSFTAYDYSGDVYEITTKSGCKQYITPNHRVVYTTNEKDCEIQPIEKLLEIDNFYTPASTLPDNYVRQATRQLPAKLIAMFVSLNFKNIEAIRNDIIKLHPVQKHYLIQDLAIAHGYRPIDLKNQEIFNLIQELCLYSDYVCKVVDDKTFSVIIEPCTFDKVESIQLVPFEGKVWCPTSKNGTFVARYNRKVFITGNTPFTNLTFDWTCPKDIAPHNPLIGGEPASFTYGDLQQEMDMINRAYIEVMTTGDSKGRVFTFPIPTYNITEDFPWESENSQLLFDMTAKYGLPYFQNFINSELEPTMIRSMCLHPNETILIQQGDDIDVLTIKEAFNTFATDKIDDEWYKSKQVQALSLNPVTLKLEWVNIDKFLKTTGERTLNITLKDGRSLKVSDNHPIAIYTDKGIITKEATSLTLSDSLIVAKCVDSEITTKIENSDIALVKIENIEIVNGHQEFYDIELERNNYFVHSDGVVTHNCCRLQLDLRELLKRGNGLFGSAEQTGSVGVVTINCARLGYTCNTFESVLETVDKYLTLAKTSLEIKRKTIQNLIDSGLYPYTKRYLGTLRNHFSTIGVNGINEMIRNLTNDEYNITSDKGQDIAIKFLDHIREKMVEFQSETGHLYNLEAVPAEGCTYRFAREDKKRFKNIIQAGENCEHTYYTNSSQLPVEYTDDIIEVLDLQETLQRKYTGGTVLHLYMNEQVSSSQICGRLIKKVLENYQIPYLTITPTFSICPIHGYIKGEHEYCPICDKMLLDKQHEMI
jgi:anaerobic ribonucleoside-triphosphate reductase